MKRVLTILLAAALLAALAGCGGTADVQTRPGGRTTAQPTAPENTAGAAPFAALRDNYAWAVREGTYDDPGTHLAAEEYAGDLRSLALAVAPGQTIPVRYEGKKKATSENGEYWSYYDGISGPYWSATEPLRDYEYLLLPVSCKDGLLKLTPAEAEESDHDTSGFDNDHGHPPADPADTARMEALQGGRRVLHAELLATDDRGGRVCLFQYENTEEGLLILAYLKGDKVITQEFTAYVYEDGAGWRADMDGDDICLFEVVMLCETDAGLVIAYLWYGPEGTGTYTMVEEGGKFVFFEPASGVWYYDHWDDRFYQEY